MPALTSNMVNRLYDVAEIFKNFSGTCMENGQENIFRIQLDLKSIQDNYDQYKVNQQDENSPLTPEGDLLVKQATTKLLGLINQRRDEISDGGLHSYEKSVLDFLAFYCESAQRGINICEGSEMEDPAAKIAFDQMKSITKPVGKDGMETLEEVNTDLGLSDFFTKALDVQRKYVDYQTDKGSSQIKSDLTSNYENLRQVGDELKSNAVGNDAAKTLLGANEANPQNANGFIGGKLAEVSRVCVAQKLDVALERFQTRRSSVLTIFSGQSTEEHRNVLEPAKKLQEVMKQLQSGRSKDGKELSEEDKLKLAQEAVKFSDTMEENAEKYRNLKTKDGTTTPNTPAGKARLGAAIELNLMAMNVRELACSLAGTNVRKIRKAMNKANEAKADNVLNVDSLSSKLGVNQKEKETHQRKPAATGNAANIISNEDMDIKAMENPQNSLS